MYVRRKSCVLSETAFIEKRLLVRFNKLSSSNSLPQLDYTIKSRQIYGVISISETWNYYGAYRVERKSLSHDEKKKKVITFYV